VRLSISQRVAEKLLEKHGVEPKEVQQCFENRTGGFLEDTREQHQTDPPTQWFIGETNSGRKLKVVFIQRQTAVGPQLDIRTAYEPNAEEIRIYEKFG
jgi:uncharacterized DUF497 family protein